jgi:hypothetical protein
MAVAMTALVVSLGGTAFAAKKLVDGNNLIKKGSLSGNRLKKHTLTSTQVNVNRLGKVPSAKAADAAALATNAAHATAADSATNAGHATTADNATNLGGVAAAAFQRRTSVGTALAGTFVTGTTAVASFNAYGGAPTVTHPSTGFWLVRFPGLPMDGHHLLFAATPNTNCKLVTADYSSDSGGPAIGIGMVNCATGDDVNGEFNLLVYGDGSFS